MTILLLLSAGQGSTSENAPSILDLSTYTDAVRVDSRALGDRFGEFAVACDVNGDGVDDWVVAAYEGDGLKGRFRSGELWLLFGRRGSWVGPMMLPEHGDVTIYGQDDVDKLGLGLGCGDINGDEFDDLLVGAPLGDGPDNARPSGGQVHVVFGRSEWPEEVDLRSAAHTVVYGEIADADLGYRAVAAGDIDGDGTSDLVMAAYTAPDGSGLGFSVGRVYVLFGRSNWGPEIDLAVGRDVTIYGRTSFDGLGLNVGAGDLNGDGTADLVAQADGGDGLDDSRVNAGDIHVFWGRADWPTHVDLRFDDSDVVIIGADEGDAAGRPSDFGDLNADGHVELIMGVSRGDGIDDSVPNSGEGRVYQPYPEFAASVDLSTDSDHVIWGSGVGDALSCHLAEDVSGDGIDDLVCHAASGDGPGDAFFNMGEIHVFHGESDFPAEQAVGAEDQDWVVYGRLEGDELKASAVGDINGDGIGDIIAATRVFHDTLVASSWLLSPVDVDGDGLSQLPDNCPLVSNADQNDSDGDRRGDACEFDWDGDGLRDDEDCADADALGGRPREVEGVGFESGTISQVVWADEPLADEFDVLRGRLSLLGPDSYGECQNERDDDRGDTRFEDAELPPLGDGFFYLIRGVDLVCPAPGSWGASSEGLARQNSDPAACPDP